MKSNSPRKSAKSARSGKPVPLTPEPIARRPQMSQSPAHPAEAPAEPAAIPYTPIAGQREAANERRRKYPYRFPRDGRILGGKFTVAENSRRLLRYFYFERRLMQALGAWTLAIPEFEVKLETGRHIFYHGDAARLLRQRLHEQEQRLPEIDAHREI